jgi:hypothetical protein
MYEQKPIQNLIIGLSPPCTLANFIGWADIFKTRRWHACGEADV